MQLAGYSLLRIFEPVVYFSEVESGCGSSDHRPFTLSLPQGT